MHISGKVPGQPAVGREYNMKKKNIIVTKIKIQIKMSNDERYKEMR